MAEGKAGRGEVAPGDHLQTGYQLWLVGHQLEHGRAPWRDPYSFQPEVKPRWNLAGWPFGLVYWPLKRAFGTVLGWNLFVLLGFLGAGGLAALWLRELKLRRGAALAGGLAFALAPYLQGQWSAGHLLAWIAMLLPLSLYGLERARRGSAWWFVLSGAALASIPLSGQLHFALGAIPFFGLYALARFRWAAALVLPALGAGLLAYFAAVRETTGTSGRSFGQVERYSADLPDLLSRDRHELEGFVYLGWTILPLAVAGLAVLLVGRRWGLSLALGLGALVPALFALGANLPGYETLWRHLPGLRHTRVPERLLPIACLALAALVAVAVSRLNWPGTAAIVVVLLLVDLHFGLFHATAADEHNRAYAALRSQPSGRLLELPVFLPDDQDGSVYLYYLMQAPQQRPGGYSTTAPLRADAALRELQRKPCRSLVLLDVRYLATHFGRPNPCGGRLLAHAGPIAAYSLAK
ncbi:MAG: hypothetical protein ABI896_03880 [Actinomycetota bacterium]